MIRITGGILKGRKLLVPDIPDLRPTTDRVRESIFNILGSRMEEARVLDLCAGTGVLGIEALSRGALEAVFVEKARKAAEVLRKNISICGLNNKSTVFCMPIERAVPFLRKRLERFDIIFFDPPYRSDLVSNVINFLMDLLNDEGIVVLEYGFYEKPVIDETLWVIEDSRRFGRTAVCFLSARR